MSKLIIDSNSMFNIEVTARESDKYTESVYVKFERNYVPEKIRGVDELFLTTHQLENLGRFFIQQATEIRAEQKFRKEQ